MEYEKFYKRLLETLALKYPHKPSSTKPIAQLLGLDQKSLARRMRGETPFTVREIVEICTYLNISLDSLMVNLDPKAHPMKIYLSDLSIPYLSDSFRNLLAGMEYTAQDSDNGRVFSCSNLIPNGFHTAYPSLAKFIYYAWAYRRYSRERRSITDFSLADGITQALHEYAGNVRQIKKSTYLFASEFMDNVSKYILFFHEIDTLPSGFAALLCDELYRLVDEIEQVAVSGGWPDTDNRVDIYVTQLPIPNSVLIMESKYFSAAIIYAFFINPVINLHPDTFKELSLLAQTLVTQSENITGSGEKTRVAFLKKQREALSGLSAILNV